MNEKKLLQQLAGTDYRVRVLYNKLVSELAKIGKSIDDIPEDRLFSFDDYPFAAKKVADLLKQYNKAIQNTLVQQIRQAFDFSFLMQNQVLGDKSVLGKKAIGELRDMAAESFLQSRLKPEQGLSLSQRIWNYTQQAKSEFEAGLSQAVEDGLVKGMGAEELGRKLRQMLQKPDDVYRRYHLKKQMAGGEKKDVVEWRKKIIDEEGNVRYVKTDLEAVGRGVYRSSRQNALRLAATEINMAYRNADWVRWQNEPFVIGIRIELSNNHTCNGKPFHDMCDELIGDYPKYFYFTGWHPRCYDEDSEVLTNNGWKHFKDLLHDDLILSLNPDSRNVEWVGINKYMSRWHRGQMVHFYNRSLDCLVTPEHEMVYLNKCDGRIKKAEASDFRKAQGAFYRSCEYIADDVTVKKIGEHEFLFDDYCEFMGYWLSDGSACKYSQVSIAQQECESKSYIIECVDRMRLNPHVSDDNVTFYSKSMREYLAQFGHSHEKFVPDDIKTASKRQIRIFLDAYNRCDGTIHKARSFVGSRGRLCKGTETKVYFTTSDSMASDLGELILKCGLRPSYRKDNSKGRMQTFRNGIYRINHDLHYISECNSSTASVFDKEFVEYDGMVYDLELEKNHIMYIRRNGKCFWGSNCRCTSYAITISDDEMREIQNLPEEEYRNYKSPNLIKEMPQNFKDYCERNADRIQTADERGTLPYWARDNRKMVAVLNNKDSIQEAIIEYRKLKPKNGIVYSDVTGGIATSVFKAIRNVRTNREKVLLLKGIVNNPDFKYQRIERYSTKDNSILATYANQFDKAFKEGEMPKNLDMARKLLKHGYNVYLMPNPSDTQSFDFILSKNGRLLDIEGKAFNGSNTLDKLLAKGATQSDKVLIDVIGNSSTTYISQVIKTAFNGNSTLNEVWLLKGSRLITISRNYVNLKEYMKRFKKLWIK